MAEPDWGALLARYGQRLHSSAGDGHHVVSPLGAWMVLALCGGLADSDSVARTDLGEVLGCEPLEAAALAGALLREPHPLVATGAGLWVRSHLETARVSRWRAGLPEQVDTGEIPSQEKLDRWAAERTLGLIERFPLTISPAVVCVLASALATKVAWEVPFEIVDAAELESSRWAGLARVLRTPPDPRHQQFLTDTAGAGPVAVHLAQARGGLLVGSVIAADGAMQAGRVLAEAERIVTAEARQPRSVERLSLFDLPLGAGPVWDIAEEPEGRAGRFEHQERFTTVMPAWSAQTDLKLTRDAALGFGVAAAAIARAFDLSDWRYDAVQSAVAKYSAVGFEAAAVTALAVATAAAVRRVSPEVPRRAVIRFRHPYAVVAATGERPARYRRPRRGTACRSSAPGWPKQRPRRGKDPPADATAGSRRAGASALDRCCDHRGVTTQDGADASCRGATTAGSSDSSSDVPGRHDGERCLPRGLEMGNRLAQTELTTVGKLEGWGRSADPVEHPASLDHDGLTCEFLHDGQHQRAVSIPQAVRRTGVACGRESNQSGALRGRQVRGIGGLPLQSLETSPASPRSSDPG